MPMWNQGLEESDLENNVKAEERFDCTSSLLSVVRNHFIFFCV